MKQPVNMKKRPLNVEADRAIEYAYKKRIKMKLTVYIALKL